MRLQVWIAVKNIQVSRFKSGIAFVPVSNKLYSSYNVHKVDCALCDLGKINWQ